MLPLLLRAPSSRPARIVGFGPSILGAIRHLQMVNWPIIVHDPEGARTLGAMAGVHVSTVQPTAQLLRQASLVLLGEQTPLLWREEVRRDLMGTGIPFWDEADAAESTLAFPSWLPGRTLSIALWGDGVRGGWEESLTGDFLHGIEGLYVSFFKLVEDLRAEVFDSMTDEEFRSRVISQIARPEILALLLSGEMEKARTTVLRIVGSTTRSL
jgi:hypothetical protein